MHVTLEACNKHRLQDETDLNRTLANIYCGLQVIIIILIVRLAFTDIQIIRGQCNPVAESYKKILFISFNTIF